MANIPASLRLYHMEFNRNHWVSRSVSPLKSLVYAPVKKSYGTLSVVTVQAYEDFVGFRHLPAAGFRSNIEALELQNLQFLL